MYKNELFSIEEIVNIDGVTGTIYANVQITKRKTRALPVRPFLNLEVRDETGVAYINVWSNSPFYELFEENVHNVLRVRMEVTFDKTNGDYIMLNLLKVYEYKVIESSNEETRKTSYSKSIQTNEKPTDVFKKHLLSFKDERYKTFLIKVFSNKELMADYFEKPLSHYHTNGLSGKGGILTFTNSLLELIELNESYLSSVGVDKDLLKFIAFLEPIGRLKSLLDRGDKTHHKTLSGSLLPHPVLTINHLAPYFAGFDGFTAHQVEYIQHILLSVPGLKEWGAIWDNATKEGEVFNRFWQMNIQMYHFDKHREINKTEEGFLKETSRLFGNVIVLPTFDELEK